MFTTLLNCDTSLLEKEILFTKLSDYLSFADDTKIGCDMQSFIDSTDFHEDNHTIVIETIYGNLFREDYENLMQEHIKTNADISYFFYIDEDLLGVTIYSNKFLKNITDDPNVIFYNIEDVYKIENNLGIYQFSADLRKKINCNLLLNNVIIVDCNNTYISLDSVIESGTVIMPNTIIKSSKIGKGCTIGPNAFIEKSEIGDSTSINASQVYESKIGSDTSVGPFAYIRPLSDIGNHVKIGDFVEVKKSKIDDGTKVSHLTYIGDATVGKNVNFGCGTVIVNYDGYVKNQTIIEDNAFIGCNTNLVSPVVVGQGSFIAAGSTITKNVPSDALAVARAKQMTKDGWASQRRNLKNKQ